MQKMCYPSPVAMQEACKRPAVDADDLEQTVRQVFAAIRTGGDAALNAYTQRFDGVSLPFSRVPEEQLDTAEQRVPEPLKAAIAIARKNIEAFHRSQQERAAKIETMPGVTCWRESRAVENVGIYIPGGSAPLFSTVLMLGIPARLAGCKNIVLCTPPDADGNVDPAILYTAKLLGITQVFRAGGIQAIAAMTFGTESIPKADKIFGPGNQYVAAAKNAAFLSGVAIDLPAGPSEVLVIADESCVPAFVAADLLSQAEHGPDSQVILVSDSEAVIDAVLREIGSQLEALPRCETARLALENSKAILLASLAECVSFSNRYAPEHLILAVADAEKLSEKVVNAGSVFIGNFSCESAGDYASGTNHTLPTNGAARSYSGVSLDSFVRKITFQQITETGLRNIGPAIERMAEVEQLDAHKNAVTIRLNFTGDV